MRVTDRWMYEHGNSAIAKARERHAKASDEVSSGTRVAHPWDDAAAAGLGATHDVEARRFGAVAETIDRTASELGSIDAGLDDVGNALSRARELAVQLSNDSYSATERAAAAAEVTGLFQSVVATLNREVGGRYLFGGFKDASPPFDAAGNYVGDTNVRKVEVAPGVWEPSSIRADVAVKGTAGGVDVLSCLGTLSTALSANDTTTLRAQLDVLSTAITQVSSARTQVGSHMAVFDVAASMMRGAQVTETVERSRELDADIFDAGTRMAAAERALEANIESVSHSGKLTLLGKM